MVNTLVNTMSNEKRRLWEVAKRLDSLCEEVVFLGGSIICLLVDSPLVFSFRPTVDFDVTAEIHTIGEFYHIQERLRQRGFIESVDSENGVICRYRNGSYLIDVVPTTAILGFTNRWYADAFRHSEVTKIDDVTLRVISPVYFLATKIEAFKNRGNCDFLGSHDLEDFIAVCDGRSNIVELVIQAADDVKRYLREELSTLLKTEGFVDCLPGHLPPDSGSQARIGILENRLRAMSR